MWQSSQFCTCKRNNRLGLCSAGVSCCSLHVVPCACTRTAGCACQHVSCTMGCACRHQRPSMQCSGRGGCSANAAPPRCTAPGAAGIASAVPVSQASAPHAISMRRPAAARTDRHSNLSLLAPATAAAAAIHKSESTTTAGSSFCSAHHRGTGHLSTQPLPATNSTSIPNTSISIHRPRGCTGQMAKKPSISVMMLALSILMVSSCVGVTHAQLPVIILQLPPFPPNPPLPPLPPPLPPLNSLDLLLNPPQPPPK